ncbi:MULTISPECIES: hypothetical protein [Nostocales]|uniref:Uncharacterized protein n=2 Tax=Nostocales TaxID=1161 RepID=A0A0C1R4G4_9CYAN|nr:hypothetical protein [Tolypothrix bouteillei]KAF3886646.1 hypothetical protein DA73_0400015035 [Tolypothrix bouteillei VB521301]
MQEVFEEKEILLSHICQIVKNLIQGNNLYQERLNTDEMIQLIANLFKRFSTEELKAITNDDLIKRIDSILVLEAVSGTLNDLTPEQIKMYEEAVERRW